MPSLLLAQLTGVVVSVVANGAVGRTVYEAVAVELFASVTVQV